MIGGARYGHTNLIASDWKALSRFYQEQFGRTPVPPESDFKGKDLEQGTGIPGVELRGVHLRLPGHGTEGPTLEIFNYNILKERPEVAVNRPGFGRIAFVVDDVPAAREAVIAAGGRPVGEVVTLTNAAGAKLTWVYVTDPEGTYWSCNRGQSSARKRRLRNGARRCGLSRCRGTPHQCRRE